MFGDRVAVIPQFQYFQNYKESFVWGSHAIQQGKVMTRKPKIGNLTNMINELL